VLAHRLRPTAETQIAGRSTEQVVNGIVRRLPLPEPGDRRDFRTV
jgi:MoxR-like ATPase